MKLTNHLLVLFVAALIPFSGSSQIVDTVEIDGKSFFVYPFQERVSTSHGFWEAGAKSKSRSKRKLFFHTNANPNPNPKGNYCFHQNANPNPKGNYFSTRMQIQIQIIPKHNLFRTVHLACIMHSSFID